MPQSTIFKVSLLSIALVFTLVFSGAATAMPPAPPNDDPGNAEVIGPDVPIVLWGTTVLANDSISTTNGQVAAIDDRMDGPDVFYSFTPNTTDTYRIHLVPWHHSPLRSSDRNFTIYIQDDEDWFMNGATAGATDLKPIHFDQSLTGGETYRIGVDHDDITHDNFPFTLIVDTLSAVMPDDCADAETLDTTMPTAVLNDIDGASADYTFVEGLGRCGVSGSTTASGIDHVFVFNPPVSGDYAIELVSSGFNGVVYVNDSCGPVYPGGCVGASNVSTGKHELIVVTLETGTDYYIYVDEHDSSATTGAYALIVDNAFGYEIDEIEPNDSDATATPVDAPLNGGQIVGPADEDWWAVTGDVGDRVYAWVNHGGVGNSTIFTDLAFYAADGTTLIEFDDEDGDAADSDIEDLRYIYSSYAGAIAGAQLTSAGTHYLKVIAESATHTVDRYRFHVGVEPGDREPMPEAEPNDTIVDSDYSGKHYYAGVIDVESDVDIFAFEAEVGDRVFIALDGDPERDGDGTIPPNTDPYAFRAKLVIYDPDEDELFPDISDSNAIQDLTPDYPAQVGFFVARTTGTHYVEVRPQYYLTDTGPNETYELAIFLNGEPPTLLEDNDPVITMTPDYLNNEIDVEATDNLPDDTGICTVELQNSTNLQFVGLTFEEGDPVVNFTIALITGSESGEGDLIVTDCALNTAIEVARIDVDPPVCDGYNFSTRTLTSTHAPAHLPDDQPDGPGKDSGLVIVDSGTVLDVDVTITIETIRPPDIDAFLISPLGTIVELVTDRGSSLAFDITDATFDDDAEEIMSLWSWDAPYTGTWLPEDPEGLAKVNGEEALGTWTLNVRDDASSSSGGEGGGSRLVEWTLDIDATFPGPETFAGTISDTQGFDSGILSIVLTDADNVELTVSPDFLPGDPEVEYTLALIDPYTDGSGTITVTDMSENTCQSMIALSGFPDERGPQNQGGTSTSRTYTQEVQADVPGGGGAEAKVSSIIDVVETGLVGEVEVDLTVDTKDVGRLASGIWHGDGFAALVNRVGMDERGSCGLTKNNIEITLDDDAPVADDAHNEPAAGTVEFLGIHQPDGRGEFFGDGITTDYRDNMLFVFDGVELAGSWEVAVSDFRIQGSSSAHSTFRRWGMTVKSLCGPEHYAGTAFDFAPGMGICTVELAAGATNLAVNTDFTPGDHGVDYDVVLINPMLSGSGTLEITDCASNMEPVAISLIEATGDENVPVLDGELNLGTYEFEGTATDEQAGDSGIAAVELAPHAENLEFVSITPDPPSLAGSVDFVVGLIDPQSNGRGYVQVTDGCGLRSHILVEIDSVGPVCTGSVGTTKRYISSDELPAAIPDDDPTGPGAYSTITVPDTDIIGDVNVTFNITHPFDEEIEVRLIASTLLILFSNIGFTGNDFIDTTLDDEAAAPIPDSATEAPFTGSYQPMNGPMLFLLDGDPANGAYTMQVTDDYVYDVGTFDSWSLTIESETFPERYDGRAEDSEPLATGICTIDLLPGGSGLSLSYDPFPKGAPIVRYSVEQTRAGASGQRGTGTVRVYDCAGNFQDIEVQLGAQAVAPLPEDSLGITDCTIDDDCAQAAKCVDGICYAPKHRYISIARNPDQTEHTARRISLDGNGAGPWWVGSPYEEAGFTVADIVDGPVYADTDFTGDWPELVNVTGCEIATNQTYLVQAIAEGQEITEDANYSAAIALHTPEVWGDVVSTCLYHNCEPPQGEVNIDDILAAIAAFQSSNNDPLTWFDIAPALGDGIPNQMVDIDDILATIQGFQSKVYPGLGPLDCP